MRPSNFLILFLLLCSSRVLGQSVDTAITFKGFLSHFEKASLPFCESYDEYDQVLDSAPVFLSTTLPKDSEIAEENDTIVKYLVYHAGIILRDSTGLLPTKYYARFLKALMDDILTEIREEPTGNYPIFPLHVLNADSFVAITVEYQYDGREAGESLIYMVTFDKAGNPIGLWEIASSQYGDSYTDDHGRRGSWFLVQTGCIDRNWELTISSENDMLPQEKFRITSAGQVEKVDMGE